jgi:hypothetical protein
LFGVMEGRVDNVNGRDRHEHPAENSCSLPLSAFSRYGAECIAQLFWLLKN